MSTLDDAIERIAQRESGARLSDEEIVLMYRHGAEPFSWDEGERKALSRKAHSNDIAE